MDGLSKLILELCGAEVAAHAACVGITELPFGIPVAIEGEIDVAPWPKACERPRRLSQVFNTRLDANWTLATATETALATR